MSKPAITRKELEAAYRKCLKMEENRIYSHRKKTQQGMFEDTHILRMDLQRDTVDDESAQQSWQSDHGAGVERIMSAFEDPAVIMARCIDRARNRVARRCPEYLPVLRAVLRNGNNRRKSINELVDGWDDIVRLVSKLNKKTKEAKCKSKTKSKGGQSRKERR